MWLQYLKFLLFYHWSSPKPSKIPRSIITQSIIWPHVGILIMAIPFHLKITLLKNIVNPLSR